GARAQRRRRDLAARDREGAAVGRLRGGDPRTMKTAGFIGRRTGALALTLAIASLGVFSLLSLAPGSPLPRLRGSRGATPEPLAALKAQHPPDDPFFVRYGHWLSGIAHGDLGRSIVFNQPVWHLIATRAGTTILLVVLSTLLIMLAGVAA